MLFDKIFKDSFVYGFAEIFTKLVIFACLPVIANILSPIDFGFYELIITISAIVSLLINCGQNNATSRFFWDKDVNNETKVTIVSTSFIILICFSITFLFLILPILFVIPDYLQKWNWPVSLLGIISAALLIVFNQIIQFNFDVLRLNFKKWIYFNISILSRCLGIIFAMLSVVFLDWGIDGLFISQTLFIMIFIPLSFFYVKKYFSASNFNFSWAKQLFKYGYPYIYASLAYWIIVSIDRWMLAYMTNVTEVGIYSIAARFSYIPLMISIAFGQAWSPIAIKIKTEFPNLYKTIYGNILYCLFLIMCIVGGFVAIFSKEIINLVMNEEYLSSFIPLVFLSIGVTFYSTQQVTLIGISIEKKTYILAKISWLTAMINLMLNFFLIPILGTVGASIATFLSWLIMTILYLYYTQKLHPIDTNVVKLLFISFIFIVFCMFSLYIDLVFKSNYISIKVFIFILMIFLIFILLPIKSIKMTLFKNLNY